ncbi:DUF4271 domain-containing protein [Prevotella sp. S7 MS 2]|uniref:DUF4271 domain-containing protein n=1 Tax=Prevotella sp. S7 MS 2 TaxID=1287488 RepID=UPI00051400C8|nr:DUF4271 domain-containing protein [Prevotella sp. S7 MS 2]KGI60486.1 membrane protein [Prevotella sp. S7 MS 2]
MWQQADSTALVEQEAQSVPTTARQHKQLTPAQVLSWLPKNATPEQQDSAIQAHIKPSEIHWSNEPDTLHLPGHPVGRSFRDVSLPKYYKESFFSKDSLFHPELQGGRPGVAGDPVPYTIAGDNLITSILLGCFILTMLAFSQSRRFIFRQTRNFFYVQHSDRPTALTETGGEMRFQIFLILQTCLLISLLYFFYSKAQLNDTFVIEQYQVIGIYTGSIAGYFLLKVILYSFINWVFFDRRRNIQWIHSYLFIGAMEGVLLFPAIMLLAFFNLSVSTISIYIIVVLALLKLLLFYKSYIIFFRERAVFVHFFLYFCALEILPLLAIWGALVTMNGYLKINF